MFHANILLVNLFSKENEEKSQPIRHVHV